MRYLASLLTLIRVHNCLITTAAVWAGKYLLPGTAGTNSVLMPQFAAFCVCAFGNVYNDIRDLEGDRINHPRRPLPNGDFSLTAAKAITAVLLTAAIVALPYISLCGRFLTVAAVLLLVWYNHRLKQLPFIGNLVVGLLGGMAIMLGATGAGCGNLLALPGPIIAALLAVLMHLGREILKDIQDLPGDRAGGARTGPRIFGVTTALSTAAAAFGLVMALILVLLPTGWFGPLFFVIAIAGVAIPLPVQMIWLWRRPDRGRCQRVASLLKLEMVLGLAALVVGKGY